MKRMKTCRAFILAALAALLAGSGCWPPNAAASPGLPQEAGRASPAVQIVEDTPAFAPSPTAVPTHTPSPAPTATAPGPLRIMPLGDSLTAGSNAGRSHSYRGYLEALLREAGFDFDFVGTQSWPAYGGSDPDHEGHPGYTIGPDDIVSGNGERINLYDHLYEYMQTEPDVILLMIGINDMYAGGIRPNAPEQAAAKLAGLVRRIQELRPGAAIFAASLAPASRYDVSAWPEYQAVNDAARRLGEADPADAVFFVDLNGRLTPGWNPEVDLIDGVHFSESGARKAAAVWFDALVQSGVLKQRQQ